MTRLMEQKAGEQESAYGNAELPSANADSEEDAEENQEPACAVQTLSFNIASILVDHIEGRMARNLDFVFTLVYYQRLRLV